MWTRIKKTLHICEKVTPLLEMCVLHRTLLVYFLSFFFLQSITRCYLYLDSISIANIVKFHFFAFYSVKECCHQRCWWLHEIIFYLLSLDRFFNGTINKHFADRKSAYLPNIRTSFVSYRCRLFHFCPFCRFCPYWNLDKSTWSFFLSGNMEKISEKKFRENFTLFFFSHQDIGNNVY